MRFYLKYGNLWLSSRIEEVLFPNSSYNPKCLRTVTKMSNPIINKMAVRLRSLAKNLRKCSNMEMRSLLYILHSFCSTIIATCIINWSKHVVFYFCSCGISTRSIFNVFCSSSSSSSSSTNSKYRRVFFIFVCEYHYIYISVEKLILKQPI